MLNYYQNVEGTKKILNQLVADYSVLYLRIHQAHWYMRGTHFYHMHQQLDTFMADIADKLDVVAERLITIGGSPAATFKEYIELTNYKDVDEKGRWGEPFNELIKKLTDDYFLILKDLHEGIDISDKENELITNGILIEHATNVEKTIWMLKATQNKGPWE